MGPTTGAHGAAQLSVHAVKAEGAAGHHAVLRRRRQADELLPDHVGRAWEEAVGVRIVGRPQDLIGTNVVGKHPEAALDRLERDPAIALEQFARTRLQAGIVEALVVEMAVHAIEPPPDSRKPIRIFGCFSQTPPQITARQASIISIVCDTICRAPRPSKRSTPTVGMPLEPPSWKPIEKSRSSAAAQNGSYIGSLIILLPW